MLDPSKYNDEPVYYCKDCLSLRIKELAPNSEIDYCDECGSTNIEQTHIDEWSKLYEHKYKYKFLDKKK